MYKKRMALAGVFLASLILMFASCNTAAPEKEISGGGTPVYTNLVWADEFNTANGTQPSSANWVYDLGYGDNPPSYGWGNNELQNYVNDTAHIYINSEGTNQVLVIKATYDGGAADGRNYTSARIKTKGLQSFKYGRIMARMKMAVIGQGGWPAFWMKGANEDTIVINGVSGWPSCGEIDIMESGAGNPASFNSYAGTLHWRNGKASSTWDAYWSYSGNRHDLSSGTVADDYHIYEIDWNSVSITWKLDGAMVSKQFINDADKNEIFNKAFYIILNLAIGGSNTPFTGKVAPDVSSGTFPKYLYIDWIKVYQ